MKHIEIRTMMIGLVFILALSAGCATSTRTAMPSIAPPAPAGSGTVESTPAAPPQNPAMPPVQWSADQSTAVAYGPASGSNAASDVSPDDRKIIKTGTMQIEVPDIGKAIGQISDIAGQVNGYVVASNQRGDEDSPSGYISIRVPATRFNDALQKLRDIATKIVTEGTTSQDVTEQYTDLQAQLKNYEATEAQYLELMKKAESVEDMLKVQDELSNVRGSIDRLKERIQYIERTTDMSLIEITLQKSRPIGASTWDISDIFKTAVDGLVVFGKVLLTVLIWILVFAPLWIIVLVIVFVVRHFRRKRRVAAASK